MTGPTGYYRIRFAADPVQLIFFRGGLNAWLEQLRWPEADRVDVVLAVSEACTNAVDHAYAAGVPGEVEVVGRLVVGACERRIVVVVRDEGRWRDPGDGPGYGLRAVHECMDQVRIRHDGGGTVVTMTSRPVPLLDGVADEPAVEPADEDRVTRLRAH
ncbi:ATP-binding protein [Pseudonocardia kunmingensis]|uniref:ATP-binding protein n=1 Tax=Pseudonocardia kunmingensis TaxID=630975 RepID=UPI0014796353|nr:ATP-binding protein [Pseudonocardia kunmingensis]